MALPVPSSNTPASSLEWMRFFIQLGDASGRPLPVVASINSRNTASIMIRSDFYPSLKIIADQCGVTIPSPAIPMTDGRLVSKDWYPALQRLAANA